MSLYLHEGIVEVAEVGKKGDVIEINILENAGGSGQETWRRGVREGE